MWPTILNFLCFFFFNIEEDQSSTDKEQENSENHDIDDEDAIELPIKKQKKFEARSKRRNRGLEIYS